MSDYPWLTQDDAQALEQIHRQAMEQDGKATSGTASAAQGPLLYLTKGRTRAQSSRLFIFFALSPSNAIDI